MTALARESWPEAELLAAAALELAPSPLARGVLTRFDLSQRPQLSARREALRCDSAQVSANAEFIACVRDQELRAGPLGHAWAQLLPVDLPGTPVAIDDDGAFIVSDDAIGGLLLHANAAGAAATRLHAASVSTKQVISDSAGAQSSTTTS